MCQRVYKELKEFQIAIFETLIMFYDPNLEGWLEEIEKDLDKLILNRLFTPEIYFVLLVLARVNHMEKDRDLRFKARALAKTSPLEFGVSQYLLLNE